MKVAVVEIEGKVMIMSDQSWQAKLFSAQKGLDQDTKVKHLH